MTYTQRDIQKLANGTYPGMSREEQQKTLIGIMGLEGTFKYAVEPKVQAFIDLMAPRVKSVTDKGMFRTIEENKKMRAWHMLLMRIADNWDSCQEQLDKAGIRITE